MTLNIIHLVLGMITFQNPQIQSEPQVECLAQNVYHEARGEPIDGQVGVAYVTMNRVYDERYPNSICKVVKQPGQFSWYGSKRKPSGDTYKEILEMASEIVHEYSEESDPTDGAIYFHSKGITPGWAKRFTRTAVIGNHIFYRR